jgi:hypothetical protein
MRIIISLEAPIFYVSYEGPAQEQGAWPNHMVGGELEV